VQGHKTLLDAGCYLEPLTLQTVDSNAVDGLTVQGFRKIYVLIRNVKSGQE